MLEPDNTDSQTISTAEAGRPAKAAPRKRAPKKAPATTVEPSDEAAAPPRKRAAKKAAAPAPDVLDAQPVDTPPARARRTRKAVAKAAPATSTEALSETPATSDTTDVPPKVARKRQPRKSGTAAAEPAEAASASTPPALAPPPVLFQAPAEVKTPPRQRRTAKAPAGPPPTAESREPAPTTTDLLVAADLEDSTAEPEDIREAAVEEATGARRRRRRGRRGRGGASRQADDEADSTETDDETEAPAPDDEAAATTDEAEGSDADEDGEEGTGSRRRRRRRRSATGNGSDGSEDDPPNTVVHVRPPRERQPSGDDGVKGVKGSTRLEAKRQRRRDGRETSRRRPPILTESEFLARREAVDRVMAVRQNGDRIQIAVLEDDILVEHYVTRASATSYVGNVYLGRVQNVLPSMEAAFVDIGKGRNGVLYAGEVNWDAAGLEGKSRAIEHALKSGDVVLVQVTKDPIGHKGARLTSQVSLPGRFLVYVPGGGMTGISRKLPDTERHRLKAILKKIVPEDAGVIIRTAAEGATEEELTRDVDRLKGQWELISKKAEKVSSAPTLVHGEPDLAIRVVRDVFNEDFKKLVVQGEAAWQTVSEYVEGVAPDLAERVSRYTGTGDVFHDLRVDEQLMKALDRKVYLPSGGSLVIDRTEAMTVIDVNTGKFVGSGGNLEQTVTRNNIEAAEEIVRQLRLRDIGGILVIDFIDMVLESNRDLVLRRLTECLGRDRTKHQVAEVTSLGLVQMTRKRVGEGLLEAFSEPCEHCRGRGMIVHGEPVDKSLTPNGASDEDEDRPKTRRKRGGTSKTTAETVEPEPPLNDEQRRAALAAMAAIHRAAHPDDADLSDAELVRERGSDDALAELEMQAVSAAIEAAPIDSEVLEADAGTDAGTAATSEGAETESQTAPAEVAPAAEAAEPEAGTSVPDAPAVIGRRGTADEPEPPAAPAKPRRRRAASRPAGPPMVEASAIS